MAVADEIRTVTLVVVVEQQRTVRRSMTAWSLGKGKMGDEQTGIPADELNWGMEDTTTRIMCPLRERSAARKGRMKAFCMCYINHSARGFGRTFYAQSGTRDIEASEEKERGHKINRSCTYSVKAKPDSAVA